MPLYVTQKTLLLIVDILSGLKLEVSEILKIYKADDT